MHHQRNARIEFTARRRAAGTAHRQRHVCATQHGRVDHVRSGNGKQTLPGFITICPTLTHGGATSWGSSFLPADYQGTAIGNAGIPSDQAKIPFIENADHLDLNLQRQELDFAQIAEPTSLLNEPGRIRSLEARINSYELAYRLQTTAPELQEITDESEDTQKAYGLDQPQTETSDDSA